MNFSEFVKSHYRNEWIKEPGLRIYVRKSKRLGIHDTIDLANMEATKPGKGALTRFLERFESQHHFYVENIFNERLAPYFERRQYEYVNSDYPWCMFK